MYFDIFVSVLFFWTCLINSTFWCYNKTISLTKPMVNQNKEGKHFSIHRLKWNKSVSESVSVSKDCFYVTNKHF